MARLSDRTWAFPAAQAASPLGRLTQAAVLTQPARPAGLPPWRVFGSYALVYVLDGHGRYEDANGVTQPLSPGDLVTVWPTLGHRYGPIDGPWTQLFVVFDGPVFTLWDRVGLLSPRRPITRLEPIDAWSHALVRVIEGEADEPDRPGPPLTQVCRLQRFMARVHRQRGASETADPAPPPWLAEAKTLLGAGTADAPSPEAVADRLHLAYSTFRRRFAAGVGVPPGRYRAAAAIDRARHLMVHTDASDKQIAADLGFVDPQHFSRRFKQFVGRTPSQFRASLR